MDHVLGRLQDLLKQFKSSENTQSVHLLKGDDVAIKVLAAWPKLPLIIQEPMVIGTVPQHRANIWKYAWRFRKIDYRTLEDVTGVEKSVLKDKVALLVAHQLIYPDGSLSRAAEAFVTGR